MVDPKSRHQAMSAPGPFRADQIRSGDPYELSRGHAIWTAPTGRAGALRQGLGYQVLATDPDAVGVAIDPGISPEPGTLRAPDLALGISDGRGWETQVPPLAVEYADVGQDEDDLREKIAELLSRGTRHIWVIRLQGPRRVEVYERGRPDRIVDGDGELAAPGLLRNPIPVAAFYDRDVAERIAFRNLLQREGFDSLEALQAQSREEGREEGLEQGREEGLQRGREEGLQRGREEGLEQGRLGAQRALVTRQLTQRFGDLPEVAAQRLAHADSATLEAIADRLLTAPDLATALGS